MRLPESRCLDARLGITAMAGAVMVFGFLTCSAAASLDATPLKACTGLSNGADAVKVAMAAVGMICETGEVYGRRWLSGSCYSD